MTLAFPNPSRSFDRTRNAVRFTGYDGMFEVPFFVATDALARSLATVGTAERSEADYLTAFDAARGAVHDAARKIYAEGRRTSYTLTVADLR
ncbi:DUF1488 domain-containing protein [Ancylobacter pratisalsi]|uniref:DUF1488 domain-containing protein n=1 Tax=Ancylobacter pratisalsi TaxID=1745854 RepID=A0A6P1YMS2_9HYPH|nr:DUF1488 domain-containing protein [Ancylobacter pratisalsi]QIB33533.1 DUF1488 domain-containing protein [Ancylobacter pratisalsi]